MLMAAARLNLPSVFLYGGSILPGSAQGSGHRHRRRSSRPSAPTPPARWTSPSSTPSSVAPARARAAAPACSPPTRWRRSPRRIGMSLPGSSTPPAPDGRRDDFAYASGQAVVRLLELGIRPRQIMTKEAFENAIAIVMALGGSTNAVLHLLAIAAEARVDLALDDFNKVAARVPHIADTKPHGKYHMVDIDRIGGIPVVMRHLLEAGLLHGDCLTVTGKTVAENLAELDPPAPDGDGHPPAVQPDPRRRRHRGAHRLAGPQGCGREDRRHRPRALRRSGPRVRRRGRRHGGRARRADQGRRHRGHPLRGPEGWARACARCSPSPVP